MGFDAANAVPKLEYDFTRYKGGKGTSPEPSAEALYEFITEWRNAVEATLRTKQALAAKEAEKLVGRSKEEKQAEIDQWASMDWEQGMLVLTDEMSKFAPASEVLALSEHQAQLCAAVFDNIPSKEDILKLPGRVRAAYFGWVVGQLINPEFGAVGTT